MNGSKPLVTILTYCAHPALAYGTLLVFKTLRTGFPTADIEVYDNGSHPAVRDQIMTTAQDVGASFVGIKPCNWVDHYRWLLLEREPDARPLVILDPDVIFWGCVEDWTFGDSLMAGRKMKRLQAGSVVSHTRLHPSLLWLPDVGRLRQALGTDPGKFIAPHLEAFDGEVHFWDTFSLMCEELAHWTHGFGPEQLDCFDHLFFGAHLPVIEALAGENANIVAHAHQAAACGDVESLRGIWRAQDEHFAKQAADAGPTDLDAAMESLGAQLPGRRLQSMRGIQQWQGLKFTDEQLRVGITSLQRQMSLHKEEKA